MAAYPKAPDVRPFSDLESMSRAAARFFASVTDRAVEGKGRCAVALSGGGTPRRTYELLATPPLKDQIPWDRIDFFWGDERCVPPADERSNQRLARELFLDALPIPPGRIHPLQTDLSPRIAARNYDVLLRHFFGGAFPALDLILLGLGEDGHTASLFPGSDALHEQELWVVEAHRSDEPFARLTMTPQFINRSATILFLVAGAAKARIVQNILVPSSDSPSLPAQFIKPMRGQLLFFIDREAARLLKTTR